MDKGLAELANSIYFPAILFVACGIYLILTKEQNARDGKFPVPHFHGRARTVAQISGAILLVIGLVFFFLFGINSFSRKNQANQAPTVVAGAAVTAYPTYTPLATLTAYPTYTPYPTQTQAAAAAAAPLPKVSILGLRYHLIGENYPRMIDLRKVRTGGLLIKEKSLFKLLDLWVNVSGDCADCKASAVVFANGEPIGTGEITALTPEKPQVMNLTPDKYNSGQDNTAWIVQPGWKTMRVLVTCYAGAQKAAEDEMVFPIHQEGEEDGWFIEPPYASIAQIAYRVNGGPEKWIDWTTILSTGIPLNENDELQVNKVWLKPYGGSEQGEVKFAAGVDSTDTPGVVTWYSVFTQINSGVSLTVTNFPAWRITAKNKNLLIFLTRRDDVGLESYWIPITLNK